MLELQPGKVLIKLDSISETINGILPPVGSPRKNNRGEVVQAGEGCEVKVGDRVIFMPNAGSLLDEGYMVEEIFIIGILE